MNKALTAIGATLLFDLVTVVAVTDRLRAEEACRVCELLLITLYMGELGQETKHMKLLLSIGWRVQAVQSFLVVQYQLYSFFTKKALNVLEKTALHLR